MALAGGRSAIPTTANYSGKHISFRKFVFFCSEYPVNNWKKHILMDNRKFAIRKEKSELTPLKLGD
jgi:hypothetical protein